MSTIIDEFRDALRKVYGSSVADGMDIQVKDGWYLVKIDPAVIAQHESLNTLPTRYRKTQLQTTIANLRARAQNRDAP